MLAFRFGLIGCSAILVACQSIQPYNGISGYQIEQRNQQDNSAILSYTLALKNPQHIPESKLIQSCQAALQSKQAFQIQLLSQQEIAYPKSSSATTGFTLKQTRIGTAILNDPQHTPQPNPAMNARPSHLTVLTYRCVVA